MIVSRVDAAMGSAVNSVVSDAEGAVDERAWCPMLLLLLLYAGIGCGWVSIEFEEGGKNERRDAGIRRIVDAHSASDSCSRFISRSMAL